MRTTSRQSIAVVTAYFWPERLGCAPYMTDLAHHLARHGHVVDVFAAQPHYPRKEGRFAVDLRRDDALAGLRVRRARVFDRSSGGIGIRLLNDIVFTLQTAAAVAVARREWRAILVLAPTVLALPAMRLMRPRGRIVAAVYDIESGLAHATGLVRGRLGVRLLEAVERWCLDRADAILVLTPQMKTALAAIGVTAPLHVVPIWPLVEPRVPQTREAPRTAMYSGGLTRRHGIDLLVPLWRHLRRQIPDCRLIVQGDGAAGEPVLRDLRAAGGNVMIRPSVERDALVSSLQEADLQLVLQAGESSAFSVPSKALTCLAAGVPFLTNALAGSALADVATASGGGCVVPGGDAPALAAAAASLLGAPQELRRMAGRGLAYVRHHHDPRRLLGIYEELLVASPRSNAADRMRASVPEMAAEP